MKSVLSGEVETVLHRGFARAREANHLLMTIEHLAVEMLREQEVVRYLRDCGTDLDTLTALLEAKVASLRTAQIVTVGTQPSGEFSRVIRKSIDDAAKVGRESVMLSDLFLAILDERDGFTASLIVGQTPNPDAFEALRRARSRVAKRTA